MFCPELVQDCLCFFIRILRPLCLFDQSLVHIILVGTHLHLHRCGIIRKFEMTEVVEKNQDSKPDPDRIGNLKDSEPAGAFPITRV